MLKIDMQNNRNRSYKSFTAVLSSSGEHLTMIFGKLSDAKAHSKSPSGDSHLMKIGLRPANDIIKVTLRLGDNYLLCISSRKEASKLVKQQINTSDDPNVDASDHK
ncbi:hypothetical protein PV327_008744 [Microctonus hyperodae]|uniref:Uncharacterized protein n=1 Tax=Microctonus hyperodae TaxID=165561 RepID=A0AA39KVC0_MICHY|nr:hypothetical protein PV327_008744 [Microctonus hyperodae]